MIIVFSGCIGEKDEAPSEIDVSSQLPSSSSEKNDKNNPVVPDDFDVDDAPYQGDPSIELDGDSTYVVPDDSGTPDDFVMDDPPYNPTNPIIPNNDNGDIPIPDSNAPLGSAENPIAEESVG